MGPTGATYEGLVLRSQAGGSRLDAMTTEELAWLVAADRYANTVQLDGTPEQRATSWAKADDALNKLTGVRQPDKTETLEIDAV